jgi:zinc/manganese transport system substrate-binding protein/zinc transport system substrate-binding protein
LPDAEEHLRRTLRRREPRLSHRSLARQALAALALLLALPCAAQERLAVVATTSDLKSLVETVGGDRVAAVNLAPPSIDVEAYQPKPQDVLRLKSARLLVRVGLDYDLWADRLLAQAGRPEIARGGPFYVDASRGIAVLELRGMSVGPSDGHAHGSGNPHYWLDPENAEIITATLLEALARIDPDHAADYETRRTAFVARLHAKLGEWQATLAPLKGTPIVAYHNSWPYFARRFHLDLLDFIETRPGVPPSPAHLAGLIQNMRAHGAHLVVREPYDPERDVAFVAGKAGATVATLAASVGALPAASDYLALFDADVEALKTAAEPR